MTWQVGDVCESESALAGALDTAALTVLTMVVDFRCHRRKLAKVRSLQQWHRVVRTKPVHSTHYHLVQNDR